MAFVQRKSAADTTERKLNIFFAQNIFFAFLLAITTITFCILSDSRYKQSSAWQLELHDFYHQFEDLHSGLTAYTTKGNDAIVSSAEHSLARLDDSIETLKNLNISTIYQRDISDISQMLGDYGIYVREILENRKQNFGNQTYYRADAVYRAINAEFRSLNYQILEYTHVVMSRLRITQRLYIALVTIFLVFILAADVIYSMGLSHSIVDPIAELTSSIRGYGSKNLSDYKEVALHSASNEEMNILVTVFNTMIKTIQKQMEKIRENADIEIKLHQKEVENLQISNLLRTSELKSLQMQINPHFLFNTLNMISQTAYLEGADQTSLLLDSTATLLRYALDFAIRAVPLSKEIETLGIYVSLLEQRFGGRIHFTFDLDESFHNIMIPALILQPLVENSITHGVGMYVKDGHVKICTEYEKEKDQGIIRIIDNGLGMNQEELEKVCTEMGQSENAIQKLGLSNVCARLQIFFHGRANMEIKSVPNVQTEVKIFLPCDGNVMKQGKEDEQTERTGL